MSEPNIVDLARSLEKLVEKLEKAKGSCPFTDEEIAQMKRAGQLVEWFDTAGWIGKRIMLLTGSIVLLISQWEGILAWFKGAK